MQPDRTAERIGFPDGRINKERKNKQLILEVK